MMQWLNPEPFHNLLVGPDCLLNSTKVSHIFSWWEEIKTGANALRLKTLCVDPVQVQRLPQHLDCKVAELVDDALGLFHVTLLCLCFPPIHKHSVGIILAPSVIKTFCSIE